MLDIHAHLFWDSYDADRDEVIRRAREAGVDTVICVGTSPEDNPQAIAMAERYDGVYASIGLHPHFFNKVEKEFLISNSQSLNKSQFLSTKIQNHFEELRGLARHPKVIAIGECGLDYYSRGEQEAVDSEQKKFQTKGFLAQLRLAEELGLPIIIHTRPSAGSQDAYEDVLEILQATSYKLPAILHCYQGDTEITKKFLALPHTYFSFAGTITYPVKQSVIGTKDDPAEVVKLVPLERLFVETDCPFLAPQERRGVRNEPAFVISMAEKICELKTCATSDLDAILDGNLNTVFGRKILTR